MSDQFRKEPLQTKAQILFIFAVFLLSRYSRMKIRYQVCSRCFCLVLINGYGFLFNLLSRQSCGANTEAVTSNLSSYILFLAK